jgi:DNA primase
VIDWVMKAEGVSFRHAVEILRADLPLSGPLRAVKTSSVRRLPPPVSADADDREVLLQVVDYYHATLKQSPEALAYLESRGLKSAEMIEHFKLGYANRTLGLRLPMKQWKTGGELRGRLAKLGVIRESGHEHFNGSVVIPIFGEDGAVTEMYGRKVTPNLRPGTPLHLYLPGPHRGVWNWQALAASKAVILCEALIDALTFWCAGFRNVTAAYGVEGFTAEHLDAFKRHGVGQMMIAFDRDEAGDHGAEKVARQLVDAGMECYRVQFPRGMDANEYACKMAPASKGLSLVLRSAVWMGKGPSRTAGDLAVEKREVVAVSTAPAVQPTETATLEQKPAPAVIAEEHPSLAAAPAATPPAAPIVAPPMLPSAPATPTVPCEVTADEVRFVFGDRRYRVRGLGRATSYDALKVNLLAACGERFHVDTFDVYAARQRAIYLKQAATELGVEEDVVKSDLGKVLLKLEQLQDAQIREAMAPKETTVEVGEAERAAALELLKAPNLLDRVLEDFRRSGVVGEETNKLVGYLAAVSRKLEDPLAVIIQSSSAAGKSSLMEAVLAFMPEEDRVKYAAMTGQSLFYMGETNLKHKILAIVEEEGAARASYALKILQSEGELTIASTGKDPETGKLITHEYRVEGPVMIFLTTTAIEIDEELMNRCIVLSVDEEREQTQAIHRIQRERQTLEGLLAREEKRAILTVHRNAQRLLRPLLVANPYARQLTFLDDRTRTRRDHMKYLTLIRTIALLHQYQRPQKTVQHRGQTLAYIEVALDDIAVANRLAHQVLGRSVDELPPQTRRLLALVDGWVRGECRRRALERKDFRFSRREVRAATGWGATQTRIHLDRLVELEYVAVHRGGNGTGFVYELAYDGGGKDGTPHLTGLLDVEALRTAGDADTGDSTTVKTWRGAEGDLAATLRAGGGGVAAGWRGDEASETIEESREESPDDDGRSQNPRIRPEEERTTYVVEGEAATLAAAAGAR